MQVEGLLYGKELLQRRETRVPNFKNYKNMKYYSNIRMHYDIIRKIGEGAFGEVMLVKKKTTLKEYALKKIKKRAINSKQMQEMLLQELAVLQRTEHQNLMKVVEIMEDD